MMLHLIRHGKTEANVKRLYCGWTDLSLCEQGREELQQLKEEITYPQAMNYVTSGMKRTNETLKILYNRIADWEETDLQEMNFGAFEMKCYEQLKDVPEYIQWITSIDTVTCKDGESNQIFHERVKKALLHLINKQEDTVVIAHGGVIVCIMEVLFPGEKNFYEWQPSFGRGYSVDLTYKKYKMI